MLRAHLYRATWLVCFGFILASGCDSATEAVPVTVPPVKPSATTVKSKAPEAAPEVSEPGPQPQASEADLLVAKEPYSPPYPNRTDLFVPPKQSRSSVRTGDGEDDDAVELNGFVTVDTPKVILSIDGFVVLLPEGEEKYGVEVISIDPPKVVLQRGRTRWTASLE